MKKVLFLLVLIMGVWNVSAQISDSRYTSKSWNDTLVIITWNPILTGDSATYSVINCKIGDYVRDSMGNVYYSGTQLAKMLPLMQLNNADTFIEALSNTKHRNNQNRILKILQGTNGFQKREAFQYTGELQKEEILQVAGKLQKRGAELELGAVAATAVTSAITTALLYDNDTEIAVAIGAIGGITSLCLYIAGWLDIHKSGLILTGNSILIRF